MTIDDTGMNLEDEESYRKKRHALIGGLEYKYCPACGMWLVLPRFRIVPMSRDALSPLCKACTKVRAKQYKDGTRGWR